MKRSTLNIIWTRNATTNAIAFQPNIIRFVPSFLMALNCHFILRVMRVANSLIVLYKRYFIDKFSICKFSIKDYLNCSCVLESTKGGYRHVKRGFCESKCHGLFAFLFFFAPFCFFTFAVGVALITVVLRYIFNY